MENRSLLYAQRRRNDAAVLKIQKQRFVKVRQHIFKSWLVRLMARIRIRLHLLMCDKEVIEV